MLYFPDPSPNAANDSSAQELRPLTPFLRSKVLEEGTFGVSHTRVPTESRPGHVALIAGLYEDVSAVATGWKLNPVNFDSVFNRSSHTWSWGSPDILPMFSTGAVPGRVTDATYGAEFEDYSKDATELDFWVFDRVKQLFKDAETDAELNRQLRQQKVVFFLHLLGLDTTGHAYRPYSREYLHNIKIVDEGVQEITRIIDEFYGDDDTAYIFTADHGMSDWGSHGDGHPDNTRTPLIAWGAGIEKPKTVAKGFAPGHEDQFSHDWHLDHVQRHDVAQADIATLMAYLVGLEFPVNSVGELPLEYMSAGDDEKAKAMLVNAKQILEMYHVKEDNKRATTFRFKPHWRFASADQTVESRLAHIEATIQQGRYQEAIEASDELMKLGLEGLRYLQTYDWLFLRALVTAGYVGWIAFAFTTAVDSYMLGGKIEAARTVTSVIAFSSVLVALCSFLFVQSSPLTYYAYAFFPVMFWEEVFVRRQALAEGKNRVFANFSNQDCVKFTFNVLMYLGILEVMVQSYYHREIYTIVYAAMTGWPLFYGTAFVKTNGLLCATWALGCASMSIFTLLPANKVEDANLIFLGGLLILTLGVLYIAFEKSLIASAAPSGSALSAPKADGLSRSILGVQVGLVALAMIVTRSSVTSLQAKQGLPLGTQLIGWATLVVQAFSRSGGCGSHRNTTPSASPRGTNSMDRDPFANAVLPSSSQVPPARVRRCSTRNDPNASKDLKYWHEYVHSFPILLQIAFALAMALWLLPVTLCWAAWYLLWQLPKKAIRRKSRMECGYAPSPQHRLEADSSGHKANLISPKSATSVETLHHSQRRALSRRSSGHHQTATVPLSAYYAANRANDSLYSGSTRPSRRQSFSTDVVHDLVTACATIVNIADDRAVASLVVPFFHALQPQDHYLHRLVVVFLAFGPLFIILTISYEGLFYFAIAITLLSWVRLEHRIYRYFSSAASADATKPSRELSSPLAPAMSAASDREAALKSGDYRALTLSDARICLFFLYLLQSAFFSTGNIASVSSFSLDAVYRLLPIFDPFSQGALLLLKMLAPFALVSANLGILTKRLKLQGGSLFAVVMGISDYLTLRFFWEVRDEGSWLDIGESISMFVIASTLCVFVAALEALSEVFVKGVEFRDDVVPAEGSAGAASNGSLNGSAQGKKTAKSGNKTK
ncbi:hypothetical protein D0869_02042 [Hortaea werneckii]|uniref:GPI ethanolamine phosphate transferase 1 n=1 Tax=Hortaea werneckii TaxID=91943 RepID=A0A3M6XAI9_HORWE|nr:hypothetical protein D0869_02042 [Hortaea werneckii]